MEEIYQYTCKMFGENADHVEPVNFFKLFKGFRDQYLVRFSNFDQHGPEILFKELRSLSNISLNKTEMSC